MSIPAPREHSSAFGGELGLGRAPTLLVVDPVRAYTEPSSPLFAGVEDAVERMMAVLETARSRAIPVVYTCVRYHGDGHDGGVFRRKIPALDLFVAGNPLASFIPEIAPQPGETVVVKQYASAFFATPLAAHLAATRSDSVIIVGLTTSGCIRATAVDACQYGFAPTVVADACGDRDVAPHEANLFDLRAKYADVTTSAELATLL